MWSVAGRCTVRFSIKKSFTDEKAVRYESVKLTRQLEGCNQMLLEMKRECQTYKEYNSISHFALKLLNVMNGLAKAFGREGAGR